MAPEGFVVAALSGAVKRICWCLLVFAVVVSAVPAPQQPSTTPSPTINPAACAQISPATAAMLAQNPRATPTISAKLAYECLMTVPNKPGPAMAMIKSLRAFVQWQSTLAWLKDPPASYMLPPTDIVGSLDKFSTMAAAGQFQSEYDFQLAVFQLFTSAHDGHFAYRPDVFKAFGFRNNLASDIVSVSKDGKELPKLYNFAALSNSSAPPAITKINGVDAAQAITDINLKFSSFQDPDSQWNSVFRSYAQPASVLTQAASLAFQGESVSLTYDNGQTKTEPSFAIIRAGIDFAGVTNGETFYNKFCNPNTTIQASNVTTTIPPVPTATTPTNVTSTALPKPLPTIAGYPFPIVRDSGANTTSGYFLNGTGYDNVAVLSVLGFSPQGDVGAVEYLTNFQSTVASFLAQSKAAGKTRLVIDVSANGGGFVVAGYELFAQLFPTVQRFQADNLRLAESLVSMARITDSIPNNFTATTRTEALAINILSQSAVVSNLIPGGVFTPEGGNFTTVEQIIAPVSIKGDLFTAYQQAPLNQTDPTFNLTGVGNKANPPPAVFTPENVVLLTDGTCGSTCTIFSYLMILQLNVKSIVMGGRPQTGAMQSIAGVEGAQVFPLDQLSDAAAAVIALAPASQRTALLNTELGTMADGYALRRLTTAAFPGSLNGKNAFSAMDSQTPLQFLYEPANCRVFYTKEMITKPEAAWMKAVDAAWNNPDATCVEGSRVLVTADQRIDPLFRLSINSTSGMGMADMNSTKGIGKSAGARSRGEIGILVWVLGLLGVVLLV